MSKIINYWPKMLGGFEFFIDLFQWKQFPRKLFLRFFYFPKSKFEKYALWICGIKIVPLSLEE